MPRDDDMLPAHRVATLLLKRSPDWFRRKRAELERAGFPEPVPVVGKYSVKAVREWLEAPQRRGKAKGPADLAGLHNGQGDGAETPGKAA